MRMNKYQTDWMPGIARAIDDGSTGSAGGGAAAQPPAAGAVPQGESLSETPSVEPAAGSATVSAGTDTVAPAPTERPWYEKRIAELTGQKSKKDQDYAALQQQFLELQAKTSPAGTATNGRTFTEAELETEANRRAQSIAQYQAFTEKCNAVWNDAISVYPDFSAKYDTLRSSIEVTAELLDQAIDTGNGKEVLYQLGSDPALAQRIASLSPTKRAVELVKIATKATAPKSLTTAPSPIVPKVGSGANQGDDLEAATDMSTWMERRNKQLKDRKRA